MFLTSIEFVPPSQLGIEIHSPAVTESSPAMWKEKNHSFFTTFKR